MPPDKWYLPSIRGRLHLGAMAQEPVHIDLVVNLTPSEQFAGSTVVQDRNFGVLLPSARVFSEIDWGGASFSVAFLDISRRRVTYRQENMPGIDWSKAAGSLANINAGVIDAKSLEQRQYNAEFFLNQIRRRVRPVRGDARGRPRALIVLSASFQFQNAQQVHPITFDTSGSDRAPRVFYIRYQPAARLYFGPPDRPGHPPLGPTVAGRGNVPGLDQLEPLLKPLEPRLFDVATPDQFRKALAGILAEIAKL